MEILKKIRDNIVLILSSIVILLFVIVRFLFKKNNSLKIDVLLERLKGKDSALIEKEKVVDEKIKIAKQPKTIDKTESAEDFWKGKK